MPHTDACPSWWLGRHDSDRPVPLWVTTLGHWRCHDHRCPWRSLDEWVLILCLAGAGDMALDDDRTRQPVRAGQLFACPPGHRHRYACDPERGWDIWYVHADGPALAPLLERCGWTSASPVVSIGSDPALTALCAQGEEAAAAARITAQMETAAILHHLLALVARLTTQRRAQASGVAAALEGEPTSVAAMAASAGMPQERFVRLFTSSYGLTPWRYILNRRIDRAKSLLADRSLAVKQVARAAGFSDANYFTRLFRTRTGISPRRFRDSLPG